MRPTPIQLMYESCLRLAGEAVRDPGGRARLFAVGGPPGAGKTSLSQFFAGAVNSLHGSGTALVLPMHDFLFPGSRALHTRSPFWVAGPHDFDVEKAISQVRDGVPGCRLLIVDGDYLYSGAGEWPRLAAMMDEMVLVDTSDSELQRRLMNRLLRRGVPPVQAQRWFLERQLPNIRAARAEAPTG